MIWVDVNVNKMGYSKNNEDSLKMDFILREMNEVDYGLKKIRWNRNIEAGSAARVYQRRIRCKQKSWTLCNLYGMKFKVHDVKSITQKRHS